MAVFVSQVLELLLPTQKFHFSLCFYFFYFLLLLLLLILHCFSLYTLSQLNNNFSIKLSQGHTSVLSRTQPQTTEIWTPGPWVWVQFTEKRWQWLSMSEFLFNCTDLLYPLSLVGINVEWSDLPGDVPLLDVMMNEFTTWRTPWCFSDSATWNEEQNLILILLETIQTHIQIWSSLSLQHLYFISVSENFYVHIATDNCFSFKEKMSEKCNFFF